MSNVDPADLGIWPTVRYLYPLGRAQWRFMLVGVVCALAFTLLSIAIPVIVRYTIDDAIDAGDTWLLAPYLSAIIVLAMVRFGINFVRHYSTRRIGIDVETRLRSLIYDAYLGYPRAFFDRHATGEVISRATNDIYPIRYFIGWGVVLGIQSMFMIVGAAIVLSTVNLRLTLVAALMVPPVVALTWLFGHRSFPISRRIQERKGQLTEASDEAVVGIEMVQAFGREQDVREKYGHRAEALRYETMREASIEARFLPGIQLITSLGIAVVIYVGGRDVIAGQMTIGELSLFLMLLLQVIWPLEALGMIVNLAQLSVASASRSFAWLQGIEPLPERANPLALPSGPLAVRFENVHFRYGTGDEVLRGIDLEAAPGEIVSVCGATGSGKTSLLNLLPRFYDPTEGRVLVGGIDTRDVGLSDLRHAIAIVTQKPVLFSGTLRDNLTAARPDADWGEVLVACETAGVAAFVYGLPEGYDTLIGERGVNLSGGQRQRVALARALVAEAQVLVLDDPMSAVDTETERLLVRNLRSAVAGRTVLVASQRLSTIFVSDRTVVLQDGRIVEDGPPRGLLAGGGALAALFGDEAVAA